MQVTLGSVNMRHNGMNFIGFADWICLQEICKAEGVEIVTVLLEWLAVLRIWSSTYHIPMM